MTTELKINYPPKFEVRYGHGKPLAKHIERIFTVLCIYLINLISLIWLLSGTERALIKDD